MVLILWSSFECLRPHRRPWHNLKGVPPPRPRADWTCLLPLLQEYQPCNTNACPELKKTTPWTPWTPVNISDNGGHYEQRFRYTCKARLPDPNLLEVGRQRIEMRYCSSDGTSGCSTDGKGTGNCMESLWNGKLEGAPVQIMLCLWLMQNSFCEIYLILENMMKKVAVRKIIAEK